MSAALPMFGDVVYAACVTAGASNVNALSLVMKTSDRVSILV